MIDVLACARFVCDRSTHVAIDKREILRLADKLLSLPVPSWDYVHHYYDGSEKTVSYLLLVDALNFCFFPEPRWVVILDGEKLQGYFALASVLKKAFDGECPIDDFPHLTQIDEQDVRTLLRGAVGTGEIPLFGERVRILREIGQQVVALYQGDPSRLVKEACGGAQRLVELLVRDFPSFRDEASYAGERVAFYKRAQIFVCDLFGSFQGHSYGSFRDIDRLTAFADYKLPQLLRAERVLQYCEKLEGRIDRMEWIDAGSPEEVEIRAATIVAVEELRQGLKRRGRNLFAFELDWLLWHIAQSAKMPPHHRTLTTFY